MPSGRCSPKAGSKPLVDRKDRSTAHRALISIFSENPDLVLIPPGANASVGKPGFFAATNLLKAPVSAAAIDHEEHVTEVIARV